MDDDNELAEENDDGLQMDPSEKAAISNSKICQYIILNINFAASTYPGHATLRLLRGQFVIFLRPLLQ